MFAQKLVYVCSPVKGNVAYNIARAKKYCREVLIAGYIPLAPHIAFEGVLNDDIPQERETALAAGMEMLKRCDELWCFGDIVSSGMAAEIEAAKELGIPVKKVIFGSGIKTTHGVKILPKYFEEVQSGRKTFEYRKDDRGYKVGDIIKLKEYLPETDNFTGNSLEAEITYILKGGELNIPTGYAIMSINKIQEETALEWLDEYTGLSLGEQIKRGREKASLTQRELAALIGAKNNSVSNWEKGQNRPNGSAVVVLSKVLNIPITTLYAAYCKPLGGVEL